MKNHRGVLTVLLIACVLSTQLSLAEDSKPDAKQEIHSQFKNAQFFHRNDPGDNLTLFLSQWEDGRWILNVEPGCIVAEVKHEKVGDNTYRFTFLGWGLVDRAKKSLAIKTDTFDVVYEARQLPIMHKLVSISEVIKKQEAEQVGAGQPATRSQSKSEGSDKPQPESEGRSQ